MLEGLSIPRQSKQRVQSPGGRRRCEVFLKLEAAQWTGALRRLTRQNRTLLGDSELRCMFKCLGNGEDTKRKQGSASMRKGFTF